MDEHQLKFINTTIQDSVLIGNPGCGKTKTIIELCLNNFKKSNEFLILTFSKKAQIDLINKGKEKSSIFNSYNIKTIHSLAQVILKKILNKSSENINTIILATYKVILDKDIDIVLCLKKCKCIIIDEAQDINENQYNLVKLISSKLNIPLILVGDPNQNIYQFQLGSDKFLLNHSNNKYILINNYRSTNQIVNFCNYLRPHNNLPLMICKTDKNKNKPIIYINSLDNILEHIINEINKDEYKLHEIAIIGSVKLSKTNINIGLQLICNLLHKNNIKYIKYFKDDDTIKYDNNDKIEIKEDHINILTCHSSKGLEFKKVLVINYHLNTFGRTPTKYEYNINKYLWYVAFTRAIESLIIYINEEKYIFPQIKDVPSNYYELISNKPIKINIDFKKEENNEILFFPIMNTINNNKYFNENNYYKFETTYKYDIIEEKLFNINDDEIYEFNKYSKLYGSFFEDLFTFYWYKNNKSIKDYVNYKIDKLENIICISTKEQYNQFSNAISSLTKKGIISNNILNINIFDKDKSTNKEKEFINYCNNIINNKTNKIQIIISIYLFEFDKNRLTTLYNFLYNDEPEKILFDINIYFYQFENECMRILDFDFNNHYNSMKQYFDKINILTINKPNYKFQIQNNHDYINLYGYIDILDNDETIIELKFSNKINVNNILQLLLYNNNYFFKKKMEIYNLKNGIKYTIIFNNNLWDFNCYLCEVLNIKMKNNIFILDIETNTINTDDDFTIPNNTEIIDRYIYEYNFNSTISQGLIKNKYKLTTSHITKIYENDLLDADESYLQFKDDVNKIFKYCEYPIFIAHNGKKFDFPILEYYDILNNKDYKFEIIDTLYLFRLHIEEYCSNKLIDLYNTICKKKFIQLHRAKDDVMLLVELFNILNYKTNEFIFPKNYF